MNELSAGLRAIFERSTAEYERRVATIDQAVAAIAAGTLDERLRAAAEGDAHKLSGALGTFGLAHGSELARELELGLAQPGAATAVDAEHLAGCVRALRVTLGNGLDGSNPGEPQIIDADAAEPLAEPLADPALVDRELRRIRFETGLAATEPVALTAGRILVVDDDESVREALVCILSEAGYDVRDVGSAREARFALEQDSIALLLSDVSMPGETGLDLIRFALCEHPQTATLLISALEDPGIAQVAIDFGAYGYLSKPVRRSAVLISVMNALRRRAMEDSERTAREQLEQTVRQRTSALSQALARLEDAASEGAQLQAVTIHRWAKAAEYHDPGIERHVARVSRCCAVLGDKLGLDGAALGLASVLHDVGMGAIPDTILRKHGPLTADEQFAVQTHAELGYEMLRGSTSSLLDLAAVIARTHHETFDGSGYPHGLSATDIPLEGRIVAVADALDSLMCDGLGRPAQSVQTTVSWLRSERGAHFDPDVIDTLMSSLDDLDLARLRPNGRDTLATHE